MNELYVIGTSLFEYSAVSSHTKEILKGCDLILGERPKVTESRLKDLPLKPRCEIFYLDNLKSAEENLLRSAFEKTAKTGGRIALFSDMGMPLLFDPGREWVELALKLGFKIRCEAGPTSWGTACALSLWDPPFFIQGFLSQKTELRLRQLKSLLSNSAHIVLMDTPYRFQSLLKACEDVFGLGHPGFLAWEISSKNECYLWGSLTELQQGMLKKGLSKGEFILILKNPSLVK